MRGGANRGQGRKIGSKSSKLTNRRAKKQKVFDTESNNSDILRKLINDTQVRYLRYRLSEAGADKSLKEKAKQELKELTTHGTFKEKKVNHIYKEKKIVELMAILEDKFFKLSPQITQMAQDSRLLIERYYSFSASQGKINISLISIFSGTANLNSEQYKKFWDKMDSLFDMPCEEILVINDAPTLEKEEFEQWISEFKQETQDRLRQKREHEIKLKKQIGEVK